VLELTIRFVRILDWCRSERQRQRDICVLCYFYELVVRANVRGRAARVRGATRPVNGRLHSVYCKDTVGATPSLFNSARLLTVAYLSASWAQSGPFDGRVTRGPTEQGFQGSQSEVALGRVIATGQLTA
jgi:hypothetical protein